MKKKKEYLLGIDIGTSACKAAVFDLDGHVAAQHTQEYPVYYPKSGWVEQDPEEWWEAVCRSIRAVLEQPAAADGEICAVGVDGQSWSAIPVDRQGKVLARTPIWMDTRAEDLCGNIRRQVGEDAIFEVAGNAFLPSYTTPKMLWFRENRKDICRDIHQFLQSNSFIVQRLTGKYSQDVSQGYGIHFFDMKKLVVNTDLARELGLDPGLIPPLFRCDETVGTVTEAAAERCGLKAGIPVVAGGLDAACAALGAGVYRDTQVQEQGGQAGGMSICTSAPYVHRKLICSAHVVPGRWLLQGGSVGGGALRWFRRELGEGLSFDQLTAEAGKVQPGADGVVFLPYMAGERSPIWDPDARGVFYGLSYDKSRGHMVRAVLEGVAFSLEHNLRTAMETGVKIGTLSAMGGAANSRLWTQIKADVTGRTITVPRADTATALGAAILAGIGAGLYRDYDEAMMRTIRTERIHEPDPVRHEQYQESMKLYLELYEDLKDTFRRYGRRG